MVVTQHVPPARLDGSARMPLSMPGVPMLVKKVQESNTLCEGRRLFQCGYITHR